MLIAWLLSIPIYIYKEVKEYEINRDINKKVDELKAGKDSLLVKNEIIIEQLNQYRKENVGLKQALKVQFDQSFRTIPTHEGGIAFTTPYKSSIYHLNKALNEYKNGNIYSAKLILEMLIEKRPSYSKAKYCLGIILNNLGHQEEALLLLNEAYKALEDDQILAYISFIKQNPGEKIEVIFAEND